jgi:nitric oxide reductase subunit B
MEYGSIFGHGAWPGPDYTADYLHRAAEMTIDYYGGNSSGAARQQTIVDFKTNRYDSATGVLTYSAAQADAFQKLIAYYASFFGTPTTKFGLRPNAITDPEKDPATHSLFRLVGMGGIGLAPAQKLFLHEQLAAGIARGQSATAEAIVWSMLSLVYCPRNNQTYPEFLLKFAAWPKSLPP